MSKIESIKKNLENNNVAAFNLLYGEDANVLQTQKERYISLINDFEQKFGTAEIELFSSPGRTEIGGNHTDHNYGRVLAGAVNLDNIAVAAKNGTNIIHIKSAGFPEFEVDITKLDINKSEFYTSASLVKGICARMKQLGFEIGGFNASIDGNVPKGSGLSSSASFEVLIGAIVSHLFNDGKLDPIQNAIIAQWAENNYFGKPCGLMDQMACSVGGFITIDFENPAEPIVKSLDFDFASTGYSLVITDTGGSHADLNDEYAALPIEMKAVAAEFNVDVLRKVSLDQIINNLSHIREKHGDRAVLRSIHFQMDNQRVVKQVDALQNGDFQRFLNLVIESGRSSFMYNQNVYPHTNVTEQGLSIGLALSDIILNGSGAWRVHGGGFAGTIQAFVPKEKLDTYVETLESVFGKDKCHKLFVRSKGSIKLEL